MKGHLHYLQVLGKNHFNLGFEVEEAGLIQFCSQASLNFCRGWKFHVIEKKFCNVATASGVENVGRESSYIENAGGGGGCHIYSMPPIKLVGLAYL